MGGAGSGGWYRWNKKTYLEDCRVLDLTRMRKLGAIPACAWRAGGWQWTDRETKEVLASIGYEADTRDPANSFLRVHYTLNDKEKMDYRIRLSTTTPYYGGTRFWFLCPVTGRRVTKLYLYGGRFISRHACRLAYASQSESQGDRLIRKKWKIQDKVGGQGFPRRPKGMHEGTYERLCNAVYDLEEGIDGLFFQRWAYLLEKY